MAKSKETNKSEAVREYLKAHPKAMSTEIAAALSDQGIDIKPGYVANIKTKLKRKRSAKRSLAAMAGTGAETSESAMAETPTRSGEGITIEQIKTVGQMVKAVGGFDRFREMLDVVRQIGGLKRFRDIVEAMAVSSTDGIPF